MPKSRRRSPITGANGGKSRFAGTDRETKALLVAAEQAQWPVTRTRGGHWRILPPDRSEDAIIAPNTASCYRGTKNLRAALRRAGLPV